jgi:hypothetical protein
MELIVASVLIVDNRYLSIWRCFTNVKALKKPRYTVQCENCEDSVASTAVRNYGKVNSTTFSKMVST